MNTDEAKKQEIVDRLAWNNSVDANDVNVLVDGDTARLEGTVPSYAAKITAENEAYLIDGITHVKNLLEIAFPPEILIRDDDEIVNNIESQYKWNSQLNAENINVKSRNGIVTLEGKVYSYWEKSIAEAIANSSVGVMGVDNNLTVLPRKSFIDVDIENDIKRELERNPLIDESKLNVSVSNGIVTLSGHVRYRVIKQQVIDIVTYSAGVIDVVDELTIG